MLPLEEAKRGLDILAGAGMKKLNIAGGEPFLYPEYLGSLLNYAHSQLGVATSVISNASPITEAWLQEYGKYVDVLGVSCDSFVPETNLKIGRYSSELSGKLHLEKIFQVKDWAKKYGIRLKLNTVVNRLNLNEDMNDSVRKLDPFRWKVFQCLVLEGENSGDRDLRDARALTVTDEEFSDFLSRHSDQPSMIPENNSLMMSSYILLDEKMRWLDCSNGEKRVGDSILSPEGLRTLTTGFDNEKFVARGGIFDWATSENKL